MILVDTSVWIEFFRGREPVAAALEEHIEAGAVLVHALVFAELLEGCKSAAEADFVTQYWENLKDAESETGIIAGGWYSFERRLIARGVGLVDAVLISEAKRRKARLWTLDAKLRALLSRSERI